MENGGITYSQPQIVKDCLEYSLENILFSNPFTFIKVEIDQEIYISCLYILAFVSKSLGGPHQEELQGRVPIQDIPINDALASISSKLITDNKIRSDGPVWVEFETWEFVMIFLFIDYYLNNAVFNSDIILGISNLAHKNCRDVQLFPIIKTVLDNDSYLNNHITSELIRAQEFFVVLLMDISDSIPDTAIRAGEIGH